MPTTVYIDITSSGNNTDGGGYTTLTQAATNYTGNKDLVTADVLLVFRIHDDFGGFISEGSSGPAFNSLGYTTDATRYIVIEAATGDECTYVETAGARLSCNNRFGQVFETNKSVKVIARNIVIKQDTGGQTGGEAAVACHKIEGCLVVSNRSDETLLAVMRIPNSSSETEHVIDSMFVRSGGHANGPAFVGVNDDPTVVKRCCIIGSYLDAGTVTSGDSTYTLEDTVIYNTAGTTWVNASAKTVTADNNAFSDATGVGTNKQLSIGTDQFTDYASGDYSTASGSTMSTNGIGIILSNPTITIDQASLTPGATISGTYSNFASTPTSPAVLTDSNSNTLNVTVTVTGTSSAGTFSGTMPSLPTTGNTSNFLLFGTVNVALD